MTLSVEEKYYQLVKFYCFVKGATMWARNSSEPRDAQAMQNIERYITKYESAVKELEAANVSKSQL